METQAGGFTSPFRQVGNPVSNIYNAERCAPAFPYEHFAKVVSRNWVNRIACERSAGEGRQEHVSGFSSREPVAVEEFVVELWISGI